MSDIGTIWDGWSIRYPKPDDRPEGGADLRDHDRLMGQAESLKQALVILHKHEPELVAGTPKLSLDEDRIRFLLDELYKDSTGYAVKRRHNFFCKGVSRGRKELGWDIPVPAPMVMLPRERSPFTPSDFRDLNKFKPILNLFQQSLADANFYQKKSIYTERASSAFRSAAVTSMELQIGRLLFSAIINGALLRQEWLSSLIESIANKMIIIEEDTTEKYLIWLELVHSVNCGQNEAKFRRRWFPDPLSVILLVKLLSSKEKPTADISDPKPVIYYLNRFFASLGIPSRNRPTLTKCLSIARTRINFRLPRFLVEYAKSINHAPSLPPVPWGRLLYDQVLAAAEEDKTTQDETTAPLLNNKKESKESFLSPEGYPDQLKKLRELQALFNHYHYKKAPRLAEVTRAIKNFLAKKNEISPMLQALGQWSLAMMSTKRFSTKKLKPSSMQDYLNPIGKPLILNGAELDITSLSSDDWANIYDQVLEMSSSPQQRKFKGDRLKEFHAFLQFRFDAPPVSIEDIAGGLRNVNANIITPREYLIIRNNLKNSPHRSPRFRETLSLLLTLGFRCGLRRNEARAIQLDDLQVQNAIDGRPYASGPELFIRNNRQGTVKSSKSTRRLPLASLLTPQEIFELLLWKNKRIKEIGDSSDTKGKLLFCNLGQDHLVLPDALSFDPIQAEMKEVTMDNSICFHSLRHSFVTFLALRLLMEDCPGVLRLEWMHQNGNDLFPQIFKLSARKLLLLLPEVSPSRRLLFTESLLCGHVDPKETIASYSHLFDWILHCFLWNEQEPVSTDMQAGMLGITPGGLKIFRNRHQLKGDTTASDLISIIAKTLAKAYMNPIKKDFVPRAPFVKEETTPRDRRQPDFIILHQTIDSAWAGVSPAVIADQFGHYTKEVKQWVDKAKKLAEMKSARGVHKLTSRHSSDGNNRYCPSLPKSDADQRDAALIYDGIMRLLKTDKFLAQRGIRLYLKRTTQTQTDMKLRTIEEQNLWIRFLTGIGIQYPRIRISIFLNPNRTEDEQKLYWMEHLKLPAENFMTQPNKGGKSTSQPYGRIVIWIAGPKADLSKVRGKSPLTWPAQGFRLAMYLGAVIMRSSFNN